MCDYLSLATPGVQKLTPYQPGKPLEELEREYGIQEAIKLASNENPSGPAPKVLQVLSQQLSADTIARYPDGSGFALKAALAKHYAIMDTQVTLGNGSNDVLELIARCFVQAGQGILFSQHAFAVYSLAAQALSAEIQKVPATAYGHDLEAMAAAITDNTRVIFIANPNNPTGTWLEAGALENFLKQVPKKIIVVLDEAYFEYLQADTGHDSIQWLPHYSNLIITRTFSKAYGLAGLRVGYSLSSPEIADLLNRIRQPFNVNSLALLAAEHALQEQTYLQQVAQDNQAGMQQYETAFKQMGLNFIPSKGNFIAVDTGKAAAHVYEALLRLGVIVRPIENYELPGFLRISIGSPAENVRCIQALQQILA
ncbi:histidinol-phosphate transaminase [Candidatus Venteria ishoeyi]|uniref:Histidinol-phosphate aminotransferase n=1 Tax=Candidatus Venteria ishoeyi TaxID=1899563 RepID=A0A1H6FD23_9GAMM|nr:histidinol-phosphate transaminase [Candidatus Venteria ishoeyi]SEH07947.1 Histidinol-phosphate aminotransferase 2 [Candidatus Venteria ishoeyi]